MRTHLTLATATACALGLALTACSGSSDNTPSKTTQKPVHSAPAESSSPAKDDSSSSTSANSLKPSTSASVDPANIKWGSTTTIIPKTGPIKLPAPKTQDAALETTFQIAQRYNSDSLTIRNSGSTDVGRVTPYVDGRLLAQIKLEAKEYKKRGIRTTGTPKLERILGQDGSYAGTGKVIGKDGKAIATKYSSVHLRICFDRSDVKIKNYHGKVDTEPRVVGYVNTQYNPTTKQWVLTEFATEDGDKTC